MDRRQITVGFVFFENLPEEADDAPFRWIYIRNDFRRFDYGFRRRVVFKYGVV